jgi:Cu-Zn family superoxide dismutase
MHRYKEETMKALLLGTTFLASLAVPASAQQASAQQASASFIDAQGNAVGTAKLTQTANGVLIELDVRGLPPGEHALHIHEKGSCDPATKFASAGGHYALGKQHGYMTAGGPHPGDLPNQYVGSDGSLRAQVFDANVTLASGAGSLLGPDGTALVFHAGKDDYASQPAGNSGDRIACAVVKKN